MTGQRIPVTIVNHVALDIAASPDAVWGAILEDYVDGSKFGGVGYAVEPLDGPAAVLGGYRIRLEQDGALADDRICHITERDEAARRLSLQADYLTIPGGFQVYATYQAHAVAGGARYTIDCHTRTGVEIAGDSGKASAAAAVAEMKGQFDAALIDFLGRVRARLEGEADPS